MVRLLAVLALAVSCVGCAACGGPGCFRNQICGVPAATGVGCGDDCGCGCDDPGACGCCAGGCSDTGCCGECGGEPSCGCGTNSGGGCCAGGRCANALADCPIGQDCRNCCLFRRGCQACGYDQGACECGTGPYPADYDYSACQNCGQGHGCCPGACCCGCCEKYTGCCCQPQGPGCCASGDHMYNFNPGPPVGQVAYPYYTVRGPRDFLMSNPPSIGPY